MLQIKKQCLYQHINKDVKAINYYEKTIKKQVNVNGKTIELTKINHNIFGDCYHIYVNGKVEHFQYGTSELDAIFNEFISEKFDLIWS